MNGQRKCGIYITQDIIHFKNKDILASATIWMKLEEIMINEVSLTEEQTLHDSACIKYLQ